MSGSVQGLPSVMTHNFSRIPAPELQRSVFDRSHGHKTTFDSGYLVPFFIDEILPGDTLNLSATIFARLSTMIFPIMDNVFIDTFFFFVPNRLVWNNWERFQGARDTPTASTDFEVPRIRTGNDPVGFFTTTGHLGDYFGLPVDVTLPEGDLPSALPFRAYNLIWNEWFRDQNLQDSAVVDLDDGPDEADDYLMRRRGKRHDYFTSVLPFPQKGDAISIPLGTQAPVVGDGYALGFTGLTGAGTGSGYLGFSDGTGTNGQVYVADQGGAPYVAGSAFPSGGTTPTGDRYIGLSQDPDVTHVFADLSLATAATINQLREAFAFQHILERDARGGTRYTEILKSHFGVTVPDFRLQRPEYLGGSSQRIDIHGVPQTSSTDATSPQGNLSSYAQTNSRSGFNKSFVEHGFVIGLVNVRADITYQQGLERFWSRRTRFDFYMPGLAHLGEQAVLNKELVATSTQLTNNTVFGYQERWAEYRYKPSRVSGLFRSNVTAPNTSLDSWHLALDFTGVPPLDGIFIQDEPPLDRVIAVTDEPQVLFDSYIKMKHVRPMPMYSVPGLQRL